MDGQTLVNLEIFCNNADGGLSGKDLYFFVSTGMLNLRVFLSYVILWRSTTCDFQVHCSNILIAV